jgi:energy-coupling factor transporter ATP-binding protein EcfA2
MKIAEVSLSNILALREFEFKPGMLTLITGANRAGKSTVVKSILALLQGAADVRMVQNGQAAGQVQVIFDDKTQASLKMAEDRRLVVRGPEGKPLPGKPQAFLKGLIDRLINPLDLLREDLKPEDRIRWVLEALPATTTAAQLRETCGFGDQRDYEVGVGEHALVAIDRIYNRLYAERTAINLEREEKRKAQAEMSRSIEPGQEEMPDYSAEVERLAGDAARISANLTSAQQRAAAALQAEEEAAETEFDAARASIVAEANRKIEEIKAQAKLDMANKRTAADKRIADARQKTNDTVAKFTARQNDALRLVTADLAIARTKLSESERVKNLLELIDKARRSADALDAGSEARSKALAGLNRLKVDLLIGMPLEGIEVAGGELHKRGVPFPLLNTEQQIDLAVDLAGLRAGKLGLLLVDGLERLDPDRQEIFWRKASATGLQFIATCVTRGALQVRTVEVSDEAVTSEVLV